MNADASAETTQPLPAKRTPNLLAVARTQLGTREAPGDKDNAEVTKYHASLAGTRKPWLLRDSIAWCSAFICWCCAQLGVPHTGSFAAKSWETYGEACELEVGCIVVLKRGLFPWQRHVALCDGFDAQWVYLTGGNQRNAVTEHERRPRRLITATRRPLAA